MEKKLKKAQRVIVTAMERLTEWIRRWGSSPAAIDALTLLPLTPKYDSERHGVYVELIEDALENLDTPMRNIAVTGSYGVGKSSVLDEVSRRHKGNAISVSLSTLGFPDDDPQPSSATSRAASTKTNRIQKEIVKQLLYSEDPVKMPGSRYRRISRFRFWRELGLSALIAVPATVACFLLGWTKSLGAVISLPEELSLLPNAVVFAALTLLLFAFRFVSHNRIHIDQLSAGRATISLSPKSATYFDEYLDEIVYFFEKVDCDLVIFEDIDRFDDAHIFETLRSLNAILNGAKQLRGHQIRFIYAIKDSIFDELGTRAANEELPDADRDADADDREVSQAKQDAAQMELARANRTKFFDLVVPIVPFITHRSARDLLFGKMKDLNHRVSPKLIDLTARYVADMRLIKNIRNEFAIFKRQVIDKGTLDLSQNGLFAMVLYKSTHLSDFELIKLGESDLDKLYEISRDLVKQNLSCVGTAIATDRRAMQRLRPLIGYGKPLGTAFVDYFAQAMTYFNASSVSYEYQGVAIDEAELMSDELWEKVAKAEDSILILYQNPWGTQRSNISHTDLVSIVGNALDTDSWKAAERKRLNESIASATSMRDFLAKADMSDLMKRSEFQVIVGKQTMSFERAVETTLKSELAVKLIRAGYIDRNYTLYTSTFYTDRVSANAMNFIMKNVDQHISDMSFELTPSDVRAVLRERSDILEQGAAYNISMLDHLLASSPQDAATLVTQLVAYGDEEKAFLLAYLESGKKKDELVATLAGRWPKICILLITDASLSDDVRARLVNAALAAARSDIDYATNDDVQDYLETSYKDMDVFKSDETSSALSTVLAGLLDKARVKLADLEPLGLKVRAALVAVGAYDLNRSNLLLAVDDPEHSLSLDAIKKSSKPVYDRVLEEVPAYLDALGSTSPTISEPTSFVARVQDIVNADKSQVSIIISRATQECRVEELTEILSETWPSLTQYRRFPMTFKNVSAYVDELGIDADLASALADAGNIITAEDDAESAKLELAIALLAAKLVLPSAKLRADLVQSLGLSACIAASSIPKEDGELVGWLIANNDAEDQPATFTAINGGDTDGLAFAISKSSGFISFMSVAEVTPQNVWRLIGHEAVPLAVKDSIVSRFSEFTVGTPKAGLRQVGNYAAQAGQQLTFAEVSRLAAEGVDALLVVKLLEPHLALHSLPELSAVLVTLRNEYEELTTRNNKHPRLPKNQEHRALAERLQELGTVSTITDRGDKIQVNMRRR